MLYGDFHLENTKIAIIGLGLMGGSLALALKGKCAELVAVDENPVVRMTALQMGIVSRVDEDPRKILPSADLVILSTPVPAILKWLTFLPDYIPRQCIVLDVGSSKEAIIQAMNQLPERFEAIGGHPICGKEILSIENAEATLYENAPFVISLSERVSLRACMAALQIIGAIGARPLWMDAVTHDRVLAFTSHLPFLLASALTLSAPADASSLVGPGFNSTSRLASTPSSMMLGVLQTNRKNILEAISVFRFNLNLFEDAFLSQDYQELDNILENARQKRQKFL
jgi:prephenate dehydrogenase